MNDLGNPHHPSTDALAVSPTEAARLAGIGRTTLYQALGSGSLRSLKVGKRRLITIDALKDWLAAVERATGKRDAQR